MTATDQPHPRTMDIHHLRARLGGTDAPPVLDVRTPAEFETSHIPGATNLPLDPLKETAETLDVTETIATLTGWADHG